MILIYDYLGRGGGVQFVCVNPLTQYILNFFLKNHREMISTKYISNSLIVTVVACEATSFFFQKYIFALTI